MYITLGLTTKPLCWVKSFQWRNLFRYFFMSMRPEKSLREDWKFPTDFDTKFKSPISVWKTVQTAGSAFNTLLGLLFSHSSEESC